MNKFDLTAFISSLSSSYSKKKVGIIVLICSLIVFLLVVITSLLNAKNSQSNKLPYSTTYQTNQPIITDTTKKNTVNFSNKDLSVSGLKTPTNKPITTVMPSVQKRPDVSSLLIKKDDMNKIQQDYENKLKKAGKPIPTPVNYKFNYQLSPNLKRTQSFNIFQPIKSVFGANICDLSGLPSSVSVFTLRNHISETQANEEAKKFGFDPPPYSSGEEAGTFTYQYQDLTTAYPKYFNIVESSSVYKFHDASISSGAIVNADKAKILTDQKLFDLGLTSLFAFNQIDGISSPDYFLLQYKKKLDALIVTDTSILKSLSLSKTVCDIGKGDLASVMNNIEVQISKNGGVISNLINSTRQIVSKKTAIRQSLEKSLSDYSDPNGLTPIVITQGTATGGTVTIDEAYVAYYDLGGMAPQTTYIPMYITSGKTGTTRVFTIFPAIDKSNIPPDEQKKLDGVKTVKQGDVTFTKPVPPTPPYTPPYGTTPIPCPTEIQEYGTCIACPGGQIDRFKSCICNGNSRTFPMTAIPSATCPAGCTQTETTEIIHGETCTCTIRDCPC